MNYLNDFLKYIEVERNDSEYTKDNYELDIKEFFEYCSNNKLDFTKVTYKQARNYINYLYDNK